MYMILAADQDKGLSSDTIYLFIGVGITLVLAVIGYIVGTISETVKWKRQQQFEAYRELLASLGSLSNNVSKLIQFGDDPQYDRNTMEDNVQDSLDGLNSAIVTAQLAGSDKLGEELDQFTIFLANTAKEVADREAIWDLAEFKAKSAKHFESVRYQAQNMYCIGRRSG